MRTSNLKTILFITLAILIVPLILEAQPRKAMERIDQLKKIKMLDVLDLDEETSSKFLVKYTAAEKNIQEKQKQLEELQMKLHEKLKAKASDDELQKLNDELFRKHEEMHKAILDKFRSIRDILPEEKFSTYLLFEARFHKELRKLLFKFRDDRRDKRRGPRGEGGFDW